MDENLKQEFDTVCAESEITLASERSEARHRAYRYVSVSTAKAKTRLVGGFYMILDSSF